MKILSHQKESKRERKNEEQTLGEKHLYPKANLPLKKKIT